MATAIGYARVSTEGQAADGVSLAAQRERITAWAVANGYELVEIHQDSGLSGGRMTNRPGLQAALAAVTKTRGAALVVFSLSRLARSVKDTLQVLDLLQKRGADLVSLTERLDTTCAAGRMIVKILASFSEFERDLASERTKAALHYKRSKHEPYGGTPFGFKREADRLVPDPDQQRIIEQIRERRATGASYREIASFLTQANVPSALGGAWTAQTVRRIALRVVA